MLDQLAAVPESIRASAPILAHSNQAVMDILTKAVLGTDDGHEEEDDTHLVQYGDSLRGSGPITDDEADTLYPPKSSADIDRLAAVRRSMGKSRDARLIASAWDDETLHDLLFGDTTGTDAG